MIPSEEEENLPNIAALQQERKRGKRPTFVIPSDYEVDSTSSENAGRESNMFGFGRPEERKTGDAGDDERIDSSFKEEMRRVLREQKEEIRNLRLAVQDIASICCSITDMLRHMKGNVDSEGEYEFKKRGDVEEENEDKDEEDKNTKKAEQEDVEKKEEEKKNEEEDEEDKKDEERNKSEKDDDEDSFEEVRRADLKDFEEEMYHEPIFDTQDIEKLNMEKLLATTVDDTVEKGVKAAMDFASNTDEV